ncbi:MAG: hypothetical protein ACLFOZ_20885 [Cyclobacteriaceae bacterium]
MPELVLLVGKIAFPERIVIKIKLILADQLLVKQVLQRLPAHVPVDVFLDARDRCKDPVGFLEAQEFVHAAVAYFHHAPVGPVLNQANIVDGIVTAEASLL